MDFDDFIRQGKVIKGEKDSQKAKALIRMSDDILSFVSKLSVEETSASPIFSNAYEAIRQILEAISLSQGYKVYSHEAYNSYLKSLKEEKLAITFDRLRKLRNGINYYGERVSKEITKEAIIQIKEACEELKNKYLSDLK